MFWQNFQSPCVFPDSDFLRGHFPHFPCAVGTLFLFFGSKGAKQQGRAPRQGLGARPCFCIATMYLYDYKSFHMITNWVVNSCRQDLLVLTHNLQDIQDIVLYSKKHFVMVQTSLKSSTQGPSKVKIHDSSRASKICSCA